MGSDNPKSQLNWKEILKNAGVAEPPGYVETVERCNAKPPRVKGKPKPKKKPSKKKGY